MKATIKIQQEVNITHVHVLCTPRYWEDATVNGVKDTNGDLMPLRKAGFLDILIEIETGRIYNWPQGTTAKVHYKVCDEGMYFLISDDLHRIEHKGSYVPKLFDLYGNFDCDYLALNIVTGKQIGRAHV